jgi:hypothetical protein
VTEYRSIEQEILDLNPESLQFSIFDDEEVGVWYVAMRAFEELRI